MIRVKSKLYYVLYFLYIIVVFFVLYLNGVFTGEQSSYTNLVINIVFLVIIGILFVIASIGFGRLNRITYELEDVMFRLQKEYKEANGKNLWSEYKDKAKVLRKSNCRMRSISTVCRQKVPSPGGGPVHPVIWGNISMRIF